MKIELVNKFMTVIKEHFPELSKHEERMIRQHLISYRNRGRTPSENHESITDRKSLPGAPHCQRMREGVKEPKSKLIELLQ